MAPVCDRSAGDEEVRDGAVFGSAVRDRTTARAASLVGDRSGGEGGEVCGGAEAAGRGEVGDRPCPEEPERERDGEGAGAGE